MEAFIAGHRTWYAQAGTQGSRVLLIMGFGMSGRAWQPQIAALSEHHRVLYYDARGISRSTPGNGPHTLERLADDADALLQHIGWPNAHVVGVSMGGMIAQHLALRHPGRIRSLTLIATYGNGGVRSLPNPRSLALFGYANLKGGEARLEALKRLLAGTTPLTTAQLRGSVLDDVSTPANSKVRAAHLKAVIRHDVRRELHRLGRFPTLVIKPGSDRLVRPSACQRLADGIPGARLVSFPRAGHAVMLEAAGAVNTLLLDHFRAADQAEAPAATAT